MVLHRECDWEKADRARIFLGHFVALCHQPVLLRQGRQLIGGRADTSGPSYKARAGRVGSVPPDFEGRPLFHGPMDPSPRSRQVDTDSGQFGVVTLLWLLSMECFASRWK